MIDSADKTAGVRFWRTRKQGSQDFSLSSRNGDLTHTVSGTPYRTYKRRWFGLVQLTLMNIVVSWDWLTYAPVADQSAKYYGVSNSDINWISTAFFLAFVVAAPFAIAALHRGPKLSFMISAVLLLIGNWIRYAGSTKRSNGHYAYAMAGEIIIGFAQPFILGAPTRYSDLWFTSRGRVAATALSSLANPLGGALGQLINPLWVKNSGDISNMVLYVSIISTVAAAPAFFIPSKPPTPVGPSAETPKLTLRESLRAVTKGLEQWLMLIPFFVYVGFFNSISSLLNQIMKPYGYTDDEAGIGGAVLIVVGLVFAAFTSPVIDRTKAYLFAIKLFIPIIALSYLIFIWMPETKDGAGVAGPYVVLALLGASSFALVPVSLEFLTELSHPLSPEVTSTIAWAGGQLCGAIFVIISDALTDGNSDHPPKNMKRALIFEAVVALAVCPLPLLIGTFGRKDKVVLRRLRSDEEGQRQTVVTSNA